ncbi:hypothetical protein B0A49_09299, partial [Cryomyces minteri]
MASPCPSPNEHFQRFSSHETQRHWSPSPHPVPPSSPVLEGVDLIGLNENRPLGDFCMDLMLVEQETKKRPSLSRQERSGDGSDRTPPTTLSVEPPSPRRPHSLSLNRDPTSSRIQTPSTPPSHPHASHRATKHPPPCRPPSLPPNHPLTRRPALTLHTPSFTLADAAPLVRTRVALPLCPQPGLAQLGQCGSNDSGGSSSSRAPTKRKLGAFPRDELRRAGVAAGRGGAAFEREPM